MTKRMLASLVAAFCLFSLVALAAQAQAPITPQVLSVVAQPGQESLGLDVYFVVTDAQGRPILDPNLEGATIQVVGGASAPVPASVGDPRSDIYVVLLLDASGSMQNVMPQVREAALAALESLPANARVSVIAFDDSQRVINDFSNDFAEVGNRIQRVQATPGGATCLYDAAWDAIDRLDRSATRPQDRRALILFTDGRDQRRADSDESCSIHNFSDVLQKARRELGTPIHTIGLCGANCTNINSRELREMAEATSAFSAIGGQAELDAMFQAIMDGLNAQRVARANIFPSQGLGQAVLAVKPRDMGIPVTTMFNFISDKNYQAPLPPPAVRISQLVYQAQDNTYLLALSLVNPQAIDRLVFSIEETEGGKTVPLDLEINRGDRDVVQIDFSARDLEANKTYTLKVQAVDTGEFLLETATDSPSCPKGDKTYLACKEFKHEPPVAPGCDFIIQSVTPDYAAGEFVFDLVMPAFCDEVFYQGIIIERGTGQKVQDIARSILFAKEGSNQLRVAMPPALLALKRNQAPPEYVMTLSLDTKDDRKTSQEFTFTPGAPLRPSLFASIGQGLRENPFLLLAIFGLVLAVLGYRLYRAQNAQKQRDALKRPPVRNTTEVITPLPPAPPAAPVSTPGLTLRVLKTPAHPPSQEVAITRFPFVIGRKEGDLIVQDGKISKRHASITMASGQFFIEDLASTNHTFLDGEKLVPNTPVPLPKSARVRFGPDTEVEIASA